MACIGLVVCLIPPSYVNQCWKKHGRAFTIGPPLKSVIVWL